MLFKSYYSHFKSPSFFRGVYSFGSPIAPGASNKAGAIAFRPYRPP